MRRTRKRLWTAVDLIRDFGEKIKALGESITEKDVEILIDLAETIGAIVLAVKGASLVSSFGTALSKLIPTVTGFAGKLAPAFAEIGSAGGVSLAGSVLPAVSAAIAGWGIGTMIRDAIGADNIDEALFPIFDAIVNFFTVTIPEFWDTVQEDTLFPIYDKVKAVIDEIKEMFQAAWGAITAVWDFVEPYFAAVWEGIKAVFSAVVEVIGGFFRAAWIAVTAVWDTVTDYFSMIWESIKAVFSLVGDIIGGFFVTAWENIKVAWDTAVEFFMTIWENIKLVFNAVEEFFRGNFEGAWNKIKEIWNNTTSFFSIIWEGIKSIFLNVKDYFSNIFSSAWETVKVVFSIGNVSAHFTETVDKIKSVFGTIGSWFGETFQTAWDNVKSVFDPNNIKIFFSNVVTKIGDALSGLLNVAKVPINGVIDLINYLTSAVASGFNLITSTIESLVNSVADTVNSLSFDIPDWAGGGTLGFDLPHITIPEISIPKIPKLATGTVVPANYGEFAAILGDNKREAEVVSPVSTIKQAVAQAIHESGMNSQKGGDIYIYIDGEEIAYRMERRSGQRNKRAGGA